MDLLALADYPEADLPLADWYADPVPAEQAAAVLGRVRAALRRAYFSGHSPFRLRLQEMIARFWLGRPVEVDYLGLAKAARGAHERALVELVYGQLLMSRKLAGALEHLSAGFAIAIPLLAAPDYFVLLKRHELLAHLPLASDPAALQDLDALLTEAAVIRRLRTAAAPRRHTHSPKDTVG